MEDKRKILVVSATVENCDVDTQMLDDYDSIFSLVKEDIVMFAEDLADSTEYIANTLKESGEFDNEDVTLVYRKNGSVFGTDEITFKFWSSDDILNRFAITYIEMPR